MSIKNSYILALALSLCVQLGFAQQTLVVIPQPQKMERLRGSFMLSSSTKIEATSDTFFLSALQELKMLQKGRSVSTKMANSIQFKKDNRLPIEAYRLHIDGQKITITANDKQGAFWAVSTIKQLLGANVFKPNKALVLPAVAIADQPKFGWRGVHLDVSRHFFDMAYLHKLIDRMALYKFNKFHWHLTDDQGWRIEIKKYPELTEKGAWRKMNSQDSACIKMAETNSDLKIPEKHFKNINGERLYGGFYSQEEVKELVRYASAKGIEIIPEIDMPGHMQAATKLFPWLRSTGAMQDGKNFTDPICPCKETTFEFAENVFKEISALFPSKYIHLGADEVEKSSWKNIPECEELMKREGLKSIDEIQSYFVKRMEKYFNSMGKKIIGWDEILDGGVSSTATMMYWRTWVPTAPKHAAEKGNHLIMTPGEFCYFDALQDARSLEKVYSFNPLGFGLTEAEQQFVLGGQANHWAEYIPSEQRLEYQMFPRLLAMAEVLWGKKTDFESFSTKVNAQLPMLDAMNINYRFIDLKGFIENNVFIKSTNLTIIAPQGSQVRYTTDGTTPKLSSSLYTKPIFVNQQQNIKVASFGTNGRIGDVANINYVKSDYLAPMVLSAAKPGLDFSYYPKFYKKVSLIASADKTETAITPTIDIPVAKKAESFATKHKGYFYAPEDGIYTFYLLSDDGSVLKVGDKVLVDNDGLHSALEKSAQVALKKGYHPFELLFIEGGGGYTLSLEYSINAGKRMTVSADNFFH